jgi:hypothetical protein
MNLKGEQDLNFDMSILNKIKKRLTMMHAKIILFIFIFFTSCNLQEQCVESSLGSETPFLCYTLLALYNSQSDERKMKSNLGGLLAVCQYNIEQVNKCKEEPSKWPIPNEVID